MQNCSNKYQASILKRGFTLIELSIVLVIIGLIVAGITGGQALVKSSELKSIINQFNAVQTAAQAYNLEYRDLPGDHSSAFRYFDTNGSGSDICGANSASPTGCNGDGDGRIDTAERYRFWQHLSLAEIFPGTFTGVAESSSPVMEGGINVPEAKIKGGALDVAYYSPNGGKSANYIKFGAEDSALINNSIISVTDAVAIEKKIDDGLADSGKLFAENGSDASSPLCLSSGSYLYSSTGQKCVLSIALE